MEYQEDCQECLKQEGDCPLHSEQVEWEGGSARALFGQWCDELIAEQEGK